MPLSFDLSQKDREFLLTEAKRSIETMLSADSLATASKPDSTLSKALFEDLGCFVTLTRNHNLRGCIGTIIAHEPLWQNVWNMARAAAFNDPRFPPVTAGEWPHLQMEISVLDQPSPCPDPSLVEIGRDGLILQFAGHSGVFLPQVPVEQGWNLDQYLNHLCIKAGVPTGSWKKPGAALFWFQALVFGQDH